MPVHRGKDSDGPYYQWRVARSTTTSRGTSPVGSEPRTRPGSKGRLPAPVVMTDETGSESSLARNGMSASYSRTRELLGALVGGGISALALFGMVIGVGRLGSFEALRLIESVLPTARFLAAAAITSALTVLARSRNSDGSWTSVPSPQ